MSALLWLTFKLAVLSVIITVCCAGKNKATFVKQKIFDEVEPVHYETCFPICCTF